MGGRRKIVVLAVGLLAATVATAGAYVGYRAWTRAPLPAVDAPFPPLRFLGGNGEIVLLDSFRGKQPVLLVFMRGFHGFICPACTHQTAMLSDNLARINATGAKLLLVYPGNEQAAPKFIAAARQLMRSGDKQSVRIPLLLDLNQKAVAALGIGGALMSKPATFIIDRAGILRYRYVGRNKLDRPSLEDVLEQLRQANDDQSPGPQTEEAPVQHR